MKKYKEHIKKHWYCFLLAPIFMTLEAAGGVYPAVHQCQHH